MACLVLAGDLAFDDLSILNNLDLGTVTTMLKFACWFAGFQYLQQNHHDISSMPGIPCLLGQTLTPVSLPAYLCKCLLQS
jgi:hypothetical protein